jgi:hypothetical protein
MVAWEEGSLTFNNTKYAISVNMWFQQDGATAHTATAFMAVVLEIFTGYVISQRAELPWPARSSDLSVCDYFLCGYLKAKVFINRPRTFHELKVAIEHEIAAIPPDVVRRSVINFKTRLHQCVRRDGKHLDGIIFKEK